ncbi:MAG: tetratricopeptide repeat protein [Capsulimonadales bacterium]|nr:tetratricopeptide repeat protein [Capsulimonadales bacterium]
MTVSLSVVAVLIGIWGLLNQPAVVEMRYSRMTLAELEKEIGKGADARLLLRYGQRLNEAKRFDEAASTLERAATAAPDRSDIRREWAKAQMARGDASGAFQQLRQFVGTHPNLPEAHLLLGRFYLSVKAGKKALAALEKATELNPLFADAWESLALVRYEFALDAVRTEEAMRKALELAPKNPDNHLLYARFLTRESRPQARDAFQKALALAPDSATIHEAYADFLLQRGQGEEDRQRAEDEARAALRENPDLHYSKYILGAALNRRQVFSEAETPLLGAAQALNRDPAVARELATTYRGLGRNGDAEHWQGEYLRRQKYQAERQRLIADALTVPNNRPAYDRVATFLARHGEVEEAIRYRALALGAVPDDAEVLRQVANDLLQGGHLMTALPVAQRAGTRYPQNVGVRETLRRIEERLNGTATTAKP